LPVMKERRRLWRAHNGLENERPMLLVFPEGSWEEILPPGSMQCKNSVAREWERQLRMILFQQEQIRDDSVVEPWFNLKWSVEPGHYGVETVYRHGDNRGSYSWEAPVKNLDEDLRKLRFRAPAVDRTLSLEKKALAESLFGDILPVRFRGRYLKTCGLTRQAIELIGLEPFMLYMYDNPEGLHRLMGFLRDEMLNYTGWFEKQGLLSDMNEDDYTGSGGFGYTDELPSADRPAGGAVRLKDMWGFAESQETVGVSPEMFAEFIWPYQIPLLEKFGLNCYGCCEKLEQRLKYVLQGPRMRRISVSPWADREKCAGLLGRSYVYSWKPNPSLVGVSFNETPIRDDLRETLKIARHCNLEIILKDLHTIQHEPARISRWVQIAREVIGEK
jgi:hypothetical protein